MDEETKQPRAEILPQRPNGFVAPNHLHSPDVPISSASEPAPQSSLLARMAANPYRLTQEEAAALPQLPASDYNPGPSGLDESVAVMRKLTTATGIIAAAQSILSGNSREVLEDFKRATPAIAAQAIAGSAENDSSPGAAAHGGRVNRPRGY